MNLISVVTRVAWRVESELWFTFLINPHKNKGSAFYGPMFLARPVAWLINRCGGYVDFAAHKSGTCWEDRACARCARVYRRDAASRR